MKRFALIIFTISVFFPSCKKEDDTVEVKYVVRENSQSTPMYSIIYTGDIAGGSNVASNNDNYWSSSELLLRQGQFISLKTECTDPEYQLKLFIYVNGLLWKEGSLTNPNASLTLSGDLPAR